MKMHMLLPGKNSGCDSTLEIDSGAHISLVSKDLVSEYVMLPSKSLSKVSWENLRLYHVLVLIGSKMVILGCDIGVKDHRHFMT